MSSWKLVKQLPNGISCGFFLTSNYGFVGEGKFTHNVAFPSIYRTNDGGTTWRQCNTPFAAQGFISSIYMVDSLVGYASIFNNDPDVVAWKTTDGGVNWQTIIQDTATVLTQGTCIYKIPNTLAITAWNYGGKAGGVSHDDGFSFSEKFFNSSGAASGNWSNGVDFTDLHTGIVTVRPSNSATARCWATTDAGYTWIHAGFIPEAWSVYSPKGTSMFYVMPEGRQEATNRNRTLFSSGDAGKTWTPVFTFPDNTLTFTGHIAGRGNRLYIQTDTLENTADRGLYRSDNGGLSWVPIGGPSNERDTRFCVTGCNGETVYAFTASGDIWKTTDGGDGTLSGGDDSAPALSFSTDTVILFEHPCIDTTAALILANHSCFAFTVDSIGFLDTSSHCRIIHSPEQTIISASTADSIVLIFNGHPDADSVLRLRLRGYNSSRTLEAIIPVKIVKAAFVSGQLLSVPDTTLIHSTYCEKQLLLTIPFTNLSCDSTIVTIKPGFKIDTALTPSYTPQGYIHSFTTDSFQFIYASHVEEHRLVPIVLHCTNAFGSYDTTIYIQLTHSNTPDLSFGNIMPVSTGERVTIPIVLSIPFEPVTINSLSFALRYDDNLLSPASPASAIAGTLSADAVSVSVTKGAPGIMDCSLRFSPPLTERSDYSRRLIDLIFTSYISTTRTTPLSLDSFAIDGILAHGICITSSQEDLTLSSVCGDSVLSYFLRTHQIPSFIDLRPNPANDHLEVVLDHAGNEVLTIQLYDILGKLLDTKQSIGAGKNTLTFTVAGAPAGPYLLRLSTPEGYVDSRSVRIEH